MAAKVQFTVFSKPWRMPLPELGKFIHDLGFDGIELPVRPGYPVEPENISKGLPEAAKILADQGVRIGSVAGPTDEAAIAACAEAGVPIIRICVGAPVDENYFKAIEGYEKEWNELVPLLDKYGVALGVQNHLFSYVANALQLHFAVRNFDPKHVCAVWDAAHNSLRGEEVNHALDVVWPHLGMVNLKSAYWRRLSGPEADVAEWNVYWTSGRQGRSKWAEVADELKKRNYEGDICLTAEYTDEPSVDRLIAEDIAYAKSLFA
jgi:sugar phosphate isomerase/epimerase